ncbi:MAG: LamG domain-containing protein, partial [Planctomycetaceae bacterium]|nr:LamG domain-containing protein [Planctomycetaceae bacterium]
THDGTSNQSDELFLRIRDGKIQFGAWHNPSNSLVEYSVLANQEYTVFAVYDDTNNSNSLKLYVDSSNNPVSGYSSVDIADIKNYSSFSPAWYVGRHGTPTDPRIFSGSIAEVAIYDTALTGTDISELFQGKDDWTVSVESTDDTATERLDGVLPDYGEWVIRRTNDNLVKDTSYAVSVGVTLAGDATLNNDYVLRQYNAGTNTWGELNVTTNNFSVSISEGQTETKIRLVPVFDWLDEGTLFNPFGNTTPNQGIGESVSLTVIGAARVNENNVTVAVAVDTDNNAGSIEIEDGAIAAIISDVNNDGIINDLDYAARQEDVGTLVLYGENGTAEYYVWVDVLGTNVFNVEFGNDGGISLNDDYIDVLSGNDNLASGTVEVHGSDNSTDIASDFVSLWVNDNQDNVLTDDWTRFTVFSVYVDMAFNHDRGNNSGADGLNFRENGQSGTEYYGAEVIKNEEENWVTPNGNAGQGNVLYLANQSVTVYNLFKLSIDIPDLELSLYAFTDASIVGCALETVTFENGVSVGTTSGRDVKVVSGVAGFVEFSTLANTANSIKREQEKFEWHLMAINGTYVEDTLVTETDSVTFYTVLAAPSGAWNTDDTRIYPDVITDPFSGLSVGILVEAEDNTYQPWKDALDFACVWATGQSTQANAIAKITEKGYSDFGKTYNGGKEVNNTVGTNCDLTALLASTDVDCRDMSAVVQLFSQIVGVANVQVMIIDGPFVYNSIQPIGSTTWDSDVWNFHQVVWYNNSVYSACEMLNVNNPEQAVGMSITDYETYLYNFFETFLQTQGTGFWLPLQPFTIETFS